MSELLWNWKQIRKLQYKKCYNKRTWQNLVIDMMAFSFHNQANNITNFHRVFICYNSYTYVDYTQIMCMFKKDNVTHINNNINIDLMRLC